MVRHIRRSLSILLILVLLLSMGTISLAENESSFKIVYLDVGEGDAALVMCDGYTMMIDGGSSDKSDYIYTYLKNNSISRIDYMVATHPDADHVGGLAGALNYAAVGTVFCSEKENDKKPFESFLKYLEKQSNHIIVPDIGDKFSLGTAEVDILYPDRGERVSDNTSIALKVTYLDTSFLFMGDNELEDENVMLSSKADLSADVIKIGHHGSASSTGEKFLKEVSPSYAVVSVGADNTYGHPAEDVIKSLENNGISIYRTDLNGIIECTSDGKNIEFKTEKQLVEKRDITPFASTQDETANNTANVTKAADNTSDTENIVKTTPAVQTSNYIANTNTMKFHYPSCSSVKKMSEKNKWYFTGTRDELIQSGYVPCKNCNP